MLPAVAGEFYCFAGGCVWVALNDGFQVEKHILGFGTDGIRCEHCQCGFYLPVEDGLCRFMSNGVFVVVQFGIVAQYVVASDIMRWPE